MFPKKARFLPAAAAALATHGAVEGASEGHHGDSYAIPTKGHSLETLPLYAIAVAVQRFIEYATDHPELEFEVTPIGCGLAGYKPSDVAPLFEGCPPNVRLPFVFRAVLFPLEN